MFRPQPALPHPRDPRVNRLVVVAEHDNDQYRGDVDTAKPGAPALVNTSWHLRTFGERQMAAQLIARSVSTRTPKLSSGGAPGSLQSQKPIMSRRLLQRQTV